MSLLHHRDEVFVPGGQPTVTYIVRDDQHIERTFARALATPNQIVSLSGPSKSGKTVLCRKVLGSREFVWIDGGQIGDAAKFWDRVGQELGTPNELTVGSVDQTTLQATAKIPLMATAGGSQLAGASETRKHVLASMASSLEELLTKRIVLVIDDFHYMSADCRTDILRNVKGAVFNGLKVVLLSVTHRAFDAIKAESELTGRFAAITVPKWSPSDLKAIAEKGFEALRTQCNDALVLTLANEAQDSPFLMQRFCWEICFDLDIEKQALPLMFHQVPSNYDPTPMFQRIAEDAGLPIYRQLAAGPQSRKVRAKRPLKNGEEADIYEATLLALADTGPKLVVKYDELRTALSDILSDMVPQKHEITSALKHLAAISRKIGAESAIDWDEENREVNIADPYLRFFLRWRVRAKPESAFAPRLFQQSD